MTDSFDDAPRIVEWDLTPFWPVREDSPGESTYLRIWREAMGGERQSHDAWHLENEPERHPLVGVSGIGLYPDARDVRVMTGLFAWFGTNLGRSFVDECEAFRKALTKVRPARDEDAYLMAWAARNAPSGRGRDRFRLMGDETATVSDLLTMECLVSWAGTQEGRALLASASAEADKAINADFEVRREAFRREVMGALPTEEAGRKVLGERPPG